MNAYQVEAKSGGPSVLERVIVKAATIIQAHDKALSRLKADYKDEDIRITSIVELDQRVI